MSSLTKFDPLDDTIGAWADDLCTGPRNPPKEPTYENKMESIAKAYHDGRLDRFEYAQLCSKLNAQRRLSSY